MIEPTNPQAAPAVEGGLKDSSETVAVEWQVRWIWARDMMGGARMGTAGETSYTMNESDARRWFVEFQAADHITNLRLVRRITSLIESSPAQPAEAVDREGGELLPCPFCGSSDLSLENLTDEEEYGVECNGCQAQQHCNYTRAEAIRRWNRRSTPTPPSVSSEQDLVDEVMSAAVDGDEYRVRVILRQIRLPDSAFQNLPEAASSAFDKKAADRMAQAIVNEVHLGRVGSRSEAADAMQDYMGDRGIPEPTVTRVTSASSESHDWNFKVEAQFRPVYDGQDYDEAGVILRASNPFDVQTYLAQGIAGFRKWMLGKAAPSSTREDVQNDTE